MASSSLAAWLNQARDQLALHSEQPGLEAQLLAGFILQKPRSWVTAHPEIRLEPEQIERLDQLLRRMLQGEPLPYLLGHWEFFGLDFEVSPAVLIPRPETEILVEQALDWLRTFPQKRCFVDVGTGSGCIAAAIAHHIRDIELICVDRSREALQIARQNLARHAQSQPFLLVQGHLMTGLRGPFDLICANLPYIPTHKLSRLPVARHEPWIALNGGEDGMDLIRALLADTPRLLAPQGLILLEIEAGQGQLAVDLANEFFPAAKIDLLPDYAGLPRIVRIALTIPDKSSPIRITQNNDTNS